jgi:PleD family two-component response regulator
MFYDKSHVPLAAKCSPAQGDVITCLPIPLLSNSHPLHVLVAEDDVISRQVLERHLKLLGHTVVLTTNGEECATRFASESHTFDIILTDIQVC